MQLKTKTESSYVYCHIRKDNQQAFYIGIGRKKNYKRAYETRSRSEYWHNIVNKAGYEVQILHKNISWSDACLKEIELISYYGRADLSLGSLVNLTNGGDGNRGLSELSKKKISKSLTGLSQSEEAKLKKSKSVKRAWSCPRLIEEQRQRVKEAWKTGKNKGTTGVPSKKKGIPITERQKQKLSISLKTYFKTNSVHNKKQFSEEFVSQITGEYISGKTVYSLSKKYSLNRKVIVRLLAEKNLKEKWKGL